MGIIELTEQKIVLLFSDGIYECLNPKGKQFGIEGILDSLKHHIRVESCISLPFRIKQYLIDHKYRISYDDFSLLAFQKRKNPFLPETVNNEINTHSIHFMTSLRAALREVGKTALKVEDLVLSWKGDSILAAKVELIVDEFLNNIVMYGYNYQDDASIVVEFEYHVNRLLIRFWDKGIEWSPEESDYTVNNPYNFEQDVYNVDGKGVNIIMSMSNRFHRTRYDQLNETTVEIEI